MDSPYQGLPVEAWQSKTLELIEAHPLDTKELFEIVLKTWDDVFNSGIGRKPFKIGIDLFPSPQIMGFFLHELIPLELEYRYPAVWRRNSRVQEKDIVYLPDDNFSIEVKTSSSPKNIYGNRSYAQKGDNTKKSKSGYYLAINFEKFTDTNHQPQILLVRFGWLDHADWIGQIAATGQQARLSPMVEQNKLLTLPLREK